MTLYFTQVLREFARRTGRRFTTTANFQDIGSEVHIALVHDGKLPKIEHPIKGSHIVRDPRDLLISGYFYHLRTDEEWCAKPSSANKDLPPDVSYQEHLRSLDREAGIRYEMTHVSGAMIEAMADWDYSDPRFLELRFENVLGNEPDTFREIFEWFGCSSKESELGIKLALRYSKARKSKSLFGKRYDRHMRPRSHIGQWKEHFTNYLKNEFKTRYGNVFLTLGYESTHDW